MPARLLKYNYEMNVVWHKRRFFRRGRLNQLTTKFLYKQQPLYLQSLQIAAEGC